MNDMCESVGYRGEIDLVDQMWDHRDTERAQHGRRRRRTVLEESRRSGRILGMGELGQLNLGGIS